MEYEINAETLNWIFGQAGGPSWRYLEAKAEQVIEYMVALIMSSPPTGRRYRTYIFTPAYHERKERWSQGDDKERSFPHDASSPTKPPRDWTGELLASFYHTEPERLRAGIGGQVYTGKSFKGGQFMGAQVIIGSTADYALFLEEGWGVEGEGSWAAPRPFMVPALDAAMITPVAF